MNTRLRDLREDNDITQEKAAIIGCISKKTYERYENGIRDIPLEVVTRYALFYKVSIDYIAKITNKKEINKWKKKIKFSN